MRSSLLTLFRLQVRNFLTDQFLQTGLQLHPGTSPTKVVKQPDGRLTVSLSSKDGSSVEIKDNDQVLMATGRVPKTQGLGLESAGVKLGPKGEVVVDEYSRTNVPSIWAVGDVTSRLQVISAASVWS
jgi:glutathione reductase (NADPH)